MCASVEVINEYLGKPVYDPYGRRLGYIVSFYSDVDGRIRSIEVNIHDTDYMEIPIERFKVTAEGIILMPEYEFNALIVENRLRVVKSRLSSLEELYSRKEIPTHVYENLKKGLDDELATVKNKAKEVKDQLRKRLHEVEEQLSEVEKAIGALKTSYLAGEIQEKSYLTALDMMKKTLEILVKEKDSLKKHLDKIESLEALPLATAIGATQQKETTQEKPSQPINVVLVE
ncbi:MAG: CdvA-like protein [Desulfurococcaceae archaeon]